MKNWFKISSENFQRMKVVTLIVWNTKIQFRKIYWEQIKAIKQSWREQKNFDICFCVTLGYHIEALFLEGRPGIKLCLHLIVSFPWYLIWNIFAIIDSIFQGSILSILLFWISIEKELLSESWFNPFHANVRFLYPLKASANQRFSDVFRRYIKGTLAWNW